MTDKQLLTLYRLIVPPWLYFALEREFRRRWGEHAYQGARRVS
jgi:hypothetical protein